MLLNVKTVIGHPIGATDGPIGKVKDFYFDDEAWVIRYAVVDTTQWLGGREVLLSPHSFAPFDWTTDELPVSVTKEQVRNSPSMDTDEPISRQYERSYLGYYGYPYYWAGTGLWGIANYPGTLFAGSDAVPYASHDGYLKTPTEQEPSADPHLRSCHAVTGYHIRAKDGEIGHVDGFLMDDSTWSIRYLIVNTSHWWTGHQILLSPEWIEGVNWYQRVVTVDQNRQSIKDSPLYDPDATFQREAEGLLYSHYGRHGYWTPSPILSAA